MPKLLRKRKQFGRCKVEGHGQKPFSWCDVLNDIQFTSFTRAQESREGLLEIESGMKEFEEERL